MIRQLATLLILSLVAAGCKPSELLDPLVKGYAVAPDYVTIKILGYQPQAGNTFQNLFVSNYSVDVSAGVLSYSTARDMSDQMKNSLNSTYGFTLTSPESVIPGFADLLLFQSGINLADQSSLVCSSSLMTNTSADGLTYADDRYVGTPITFLGLRDCDKVYMGLNPSMFSFNGSGIPDYLQIRCGMNPLDKDEAFVSTAGDGVLNIDKCKRHIPIAESAFTTANQAYAYQYSTLLHSNNTSDFTISNIPILNTGTENFIAFYVTETNSGTNISSVYTAYAVLKAGYSGKTLEFNYWATSPATFSNQEIVVP